MSITVIYTYSVLITPQTPLFHWPSCHPPPIVPLILSCLTCDIQHMCHACTSMGCAFWSFKDSSVSKNWSYHTAQGLMINLTVKWHCHKQYIQKRGLRREKALLMKLWSNRQLKNITGTRPIKGSAQNWNLDVICARVIFLKIVA